MALLMMTHMRKLLGVGTVALALILPATAGASIGSTTVGGSTDTNAIGQAQDYQYTASASQSVNALNLYLSSTNTASKVEVGLYSGANAKLGSCVLSAPKAGAWNQCAIPAVSLTGGSTYKLAMLQPTGSSGSIKYRENDYGAQTYGSRPGLASLPATWVNAYNWGNQTASLYANSTVAPPPPPPPPADSDGDGVPDSTDQCPGTPAGTQVDSVGCPVPPPPPPPPPPSGSFPTQATTGTPAGWTPSVTRSTDMTVSTQGAVVQNIRFTNGAKLTVTARDVTVKDVELQGGTIQSDNQNTLIEDSTIDAIGSTVNDGEGVISYCGYTILRVKILDRNEGVRSGCADPVVVQDSFIKIVPPSVCTDWHGDGFQGYTGGPSTLNNDTIDFNEGYGTPSFCGGTAPVFYPDSQGNTHLDVNHLLVSGGGESFRDGMPGNISDLQIECNTPGTDTCWHFYPIDVRCGTVTSWQATIVTVDETNWTTTKQRDQPCDTA